MAIDDAIEPEQVRIERDCLGPCDTFAIEGVEPMVGDGALKIGFGATRRKPDRRRDIGERQVVRAALTISLSPAQIRLGTVGVVRDRAGEISDRLPIAADLGVGLAAVNVGFDVARIVSDDPIEVGDRRQKARLMAAQAVL